MKFLCKIFYSLNKIGVSYNYTCNIRIDQIWMQLITLDKVNSDLRFIGYDVTSDTRGRPIQNCRTIRLYNNTLNHITHNQSTKRVDAILHILARKRVSLNLSASPQ